MPTSSKSSAETLDLILATAREHHLNGRLDQAKVNYQEVLKQQPLNSDALYLLGLVIYRQGDVELAIDRVLKAIKSDPDHVLANASLAQIYQDQSDHKRAVLYYRRATELDATMPALFNGLGLSLTQLGKYHAALKAYMQALELKPNMLEACNNLGNLYRSMGKLDQAEKSYLRCLKIQPDFVQAFNNLGVLYQQQQKPKQAIKLFETAIGIKYGYAEAHNNLGAAFNDVGEIDRALVHFTKAIVIKPQFTEASINAAMVQQNLGFHNQARELLDQVIQIEPGNLTAQWLRCICELETVYSSMEAINEARSAYESRLKDLSTQASFEASGQDVLTTVAVGSMQPFLLPYQGMNDKTLQMIYGDFLTRSTQLHVPEPLPASRKSGPVRVGIVSAFFYDHSNWKVPIQGWLKSLYADFEVSAYYTGMRHDRATAVAEKLCTHFYSGLSVQQFATVIMNDEIDVLIYPEVGMHPVTCQLACQRLAKIQCVSWGHPVTSGLPTMDYFLSSELMEPEAAQSQYTEKLVRLAGLSFSWTSPEYDTSTIVDFGFSDDEIICLCVQNLSKYLPQHDYLLVEIARQVSEIKLVFIEGAEGSTRLLKKRLLACFEDAGLNFEKKVLFMPRLNRDDFHALNRRADFSLDSVEWSGCNTTLEALNCDLPMVTLPGQWMRGRHSYAIYRKMLYEELIARDEKHYIELAVRLAKDKAWREQQRQKISQAKFRLVEDDEPVGGLADIISGLVEL